MVISAVSINKKYPATGESVTISFKLTVASSDDKVNGDVELVLSPMDRYSDGGFSSGEFVGTKKGVSIAKGASKTLSYTFDFPDIAILTNDNGAARQYLYGFSVLAHTGYGFLEATKTNVGRFLTARLAPSIDTFALVDGTGGFEHFGAYVQNASDISVSAMATIDPLDPTLTASHSLVIATTAGTTLYEAVQPTGAFDVGALDVVGDCSYVYRIADSMGLSAAVSGVLKVLAYTPPSLSGLTAQRYKTLIDDDGHVSYVASAEGEQVRFSFAGTIAPVASLNAWVLGVVYGISDSQATTAASVLSGSDGQAISAAEDRALLADVIPKANGYDFTFTLKDFFNAIVLTASVSKAGALLNVERYGVGVGMLSTGTKGDPKFETAYPIHAYASAYDSEGNEYLHPHDTGWQTLPLSSGVSASVHNSGAAAKPQYRKIGNHVYIRGTIGCSSIIGAALVHIATVPAEVAPKATEIHTTCGTSARTCRGEIRTDGTYYLGFCYTQSGAANATTAVWYDITMDYWLD